MRHHLNLLVPMASTRYSLSKWGSPTLAPAFLRLRSRKLVVPNGGGDREDETLRVLDGTPPVSST